MNQAVADPLGIVSVYSGGYRNIFDVAITEDGRLYTFDNGPNTNWGGEPLNAAGQVIVDQTSQVDHDGDGNLNEPDGLPDNGPATGRASELQSNFRRINCISWTSTSMTPTARCIWMVPPRTAPITLPRGTAITAGTPW